MTGAGLAAVVGLALAGAGPDTRPAPRPVAPSLDTAIVPQRIREACIVAGDYLVRFQQPTGRFDYIYDASRDQIDRRTYNLPRHAGTTFALLQLARATGQERYRAAAVKALAWLLASCAERPSDQGRLLFPVYRSRTKVGSVALATLAFVEGAEVFARRDLTDHAAALGRCLIACQRPDGMFGWYYPGGTHPRLLPRDGESEYYPGEALLGLVRLYRLTRDVRWLNAALKTADDLVGGARDRRRRQAGLPVPLHDHWLIQALEQLYYADPKPRWVDHAVWTARAIARSQLTPATVTDPNGVGGWYARNPRVTPAATRLEGLASAYRLVRRAGRDTGWLVVPIRRATRFILQHQFTPQRTYGVPNPARALGGFPCSRRRLSVRIDYVQHSISALLGAADILAVVGPATRRRHDVPGRDTPQR